MDIGRNDTTRPPSRRRTGKRLALAAALGAGAALALTAPAGAAPGDLSDRGCLGAGTLGCAPAPSLDAARSVATTADGSSVYVASNSGVSHFARDPRGGLSFRGCAGAGTGCTQVASIRGAQAVAVSPDGRSVYVASSAAKSVTHLAPDAAGNLVDRGCVAGGTPGCAPVASLEGPVALAVSPDGRAVYAGSAVGGAVTHLARDDEGRLFDRGCVGESAGCTAVASLTGVTSLAISPDGSALYAAAIADDAVTHLARDADGRLFDRGCVGDGTAGCTQVASLGGAFGVTVSPDGNAVYVASAADSALTHLARDASGRLFDRGCVGAAATCAPVASLAGAASVAVSPDGTSVYVASRAGRSVTHLARDAEGRLFDRGCVGDNTAGCGQVGSLNGAQGLAIAPDGAAVYVAAEIDSALTHLAREVPPPGFRVTPNGPGGGAGGRGSTAALFCGGRRATIVARGRVTRGTARGDVIVGRRGPDVIRGLGGNDLICGGGGADRLFGGGGADRLLGGAGRDLLVGGRGRDRILGGPGRDTVLR